MVANFIFFLFCIFMAWLLYRFPFKNAKTPDEYRKLFFFFCVLTGFVLFNAFLAFLGMGGLKLASTGVPITSMTDLAGKKSEDAILLVGEVSDQNDSMMGDYIAYLDDQHLWTPMHLWIELEDGRIAITNTTYQAAGWLVDANQYSYLLAGQPVTVVGFLENAVTLPSGEKSQSVRASIVYAGTHEKFTSRARIKGVIATGMMLLNILAAIVIVVGPLLECRKEMIKKRDLPEIRK